MRKSQTLYLTTDKTKPQYSSIIKENPAIAFTVARAVNILCKSILYFKNKIIEDKICIPYTILHYMVIYLPTNIFIFAIII